MERLRNLAARFTGATNRGEAFAYCAFVCVGFLLAATLTSMYYGDGYAFQLVTLAGICWLIGDRYCE